VSRDPKRLKVFGLADDLVAEVYGATQRFPAAERYGLQAQLRRAAVSVPTNIVEGCARSSSRDYLRFLVLALGSASEVNYLLGLAERLGVLKTDAALSEHSAQLVRAMQALVAAITRRAEKEDRHTRISSPQ
jgi:four helix bundle protein